MIARMNVIEYPAEQFELVFQNLKVVLFPALKEQKGFQDILVMRNGDSGKAYMILLWESPEAAQNWVNSPAFRQVGVNLHSRSGFDWKSRPPFEEYQVLYRL